MSHSTKAFTIILALAAVLFCPTRATLAQPTVKTETQPRITSKRMEMPEGAIHGTLYVTIGGKERKVSETALDAWIIQGGRSIVYSGRDGAGGFENEGQSLRIYDAQTGKQRKIMSEYFMVDTVTEVTTSTNKTALLVKLSDGGLGASYLAVVDPSRGEVFFRRWVRLLSRRGDIITIGHYKEDDWNTFIENENAKVKPYKIERQNLNLLLRRRVIFNKPENLALALSPPSD
jgi:hypothetical protein